MIKKEEVENYKNYLNEYQAKLKYGIKNGLVRIYDEELLSKLRHIYCGGVPASILLLTQGFANGFCYDRAHLVTMAFGNDEYYVACGSVKSLRINPELLEKYREGKMSKLYDDHCVALRKEKNGKEWIYDTSMGFIFEKNFYYELDDFQVRKIENKDEIQEFLYFDFLRDTSFEEEKYVLPFIISKIEETMVPTQEFYLEMLQREIAILKEEVGYDELYKEVQEDMKRLGFIPLN